MDEFTKAVAQRFLEVKGGRLTKAELATALDAAFSTDEIEAGLAHLEGRNKVLVCDEVVFMIE
jgi:hypothetical protein